MKFTQLQLRAYGPFTGKVIDFSEHAGLQILYGPNEAGKSSTLRAIADVLFGIPPRTTDNFLHPYPKLRIGVTLKKQNGQSFQAVRRKGNQQTLRDSHDEKPVPEESLQSFLGEIDRETFAIMFGIDHTRLRQGGEEIANGKGKVGELLFAAGTGLVNLQHFKQQLQNEQEAIFKPRSRSSLLNQKLEEYARLRQEIKEVQFSVETWKKLETELEQREQEKQKLEETLQTHSKLLSRWQRIQEITPVVIQWQRERTELETLQEIPLLPEDYGSRIQQLLTEKIRWEHQRQESQLALQEIEENLAPLTINSQLLQEEPAINALLHELGGHLKAKADRPQLVTSCELAEAEVREILRQLGRSGDLTEVESLRVPNSTAVCIQNLGNQYEGLTERRDSWKRDCERHRREIVRLEEQLRQTPRPASITTFKECVQRIQQKGDLELRLTELTAQQAEQEQQTQIALRQLSLWSGTLEELEKIPIPLLPTIERYEHRFRELENKIQTQTNRIEEEQQSEIMLQHKLASLERVNRILTEKELMQARELRQQGWQLVLQEWKGEGADSAELQPFLQEFSQTELPEAFDRSVLEADRVVDILRHDAGRVASKTELQNALHNQSRKLETLRNSLKEFQQTKAEIQQEWTSMWAATGLSPHPPEEMLLWIRQQERLLEFAEELRELAVQIQKIQQHITAAQTELTREMRKFPTFQQEIRAEKLSELMLLAVDHLEAMQAEATRHQQLEHQLEAAKQGIQEAEPRWQEAEEDLQIWQQAWAAEMQKIGLTATAQPAQANQVLSDLGKLFAKLHEQEDKQTRIAGIDQDALNFRQHVQEVVQRVGLNSAERPGNELVAELSSQLQLAKSQQERLLVFVKQKQNLQQKLQQSEQELAAQQTMLQELAALAGTQETGQLLEIAQKSQRKRFLEQQVQERETQIELKRADQPLEEFVQDVQAAAGQMDSLPGTIRKLETEILELQKSRDDLLEKISTVRHEFQRVDGGNQAADKAMQCESLTAGIEEEIQRFITLRTAASILSQAVERHREKNQGPVLHRASEYFARLTCGAFQRLQADYNERGEPILTGLRSDRQEAIPVEAMSDGTCDQLYLALRLASLEAWLAEHEPVPFIVDDILLNFDDARALAALQVLEEFSTKTQILLFTHHQHLLTLIEKHLPAEKIEIHDLLRCSAASGLLYQ